MAKEGLDYFPFNCQLDEKFELIEAEFGLKGFAVVVKLLQRIYGEHGYYCEWTNEVELLFSKRLGLRHDEEGCSFVSEILEASIKRGIFSRELYEEYGILTSQGIQRRYLDAVSRRKEVYLKSEYLLINVDKKYKNVCISNENVNIKSKNENISKQSKVKESKVYIESSEEIPQAKFASDSFEMQCVNYLIEQLLKELPNSKVPKTDKELEKWANYISLMIRKDNRSESDIKKVLEFATTDPFWRTNIRSTFKFREKYETLYLQMNKKGSSSGSKNSFNNFGQRDYNYSDLERQLLQANSGGSK